MTSIHCRARRDCARTSAGFPGHTSPFWACSPASTRMLSTRTAPALVSSRADRKTMTHRNALTVEDHRLGAGQAMPEGRRDSGPYHILAASGLTDERTRVLKHGDTFAVLDHYGDIKPGGLGEEGLYHEDTRYLSCLLLELEESRPFFLSSTVRDENDQLAVTLTNPDLCHGGEVRVPLGTLHLALKKFLWQG